MMKKTLLWSVVAMMALSSCQDEFINDKHKKNDKIGYAVEATNMAAPKKSRADGSSASCEVRIEKLNETLDGQPLYLHTISDREMPLNVKSSKQETVQSRGAVNTTAGILASDTEIGVTSIVWNGDAWEDDDEKKLYMNNLPCESPDFKTNFYWPAAEDYIRFFAYYPYGAEYKDGELTSEVSINSSDKTEPYMRWVVPATPDKQDDLLVASANYAGNYKNQATLKFGHALTGVQILISGEVSNIEVNAIHFNGVKYKGKYFYSTVNGNDTDAGEWDVDSDTTTISLTELEVTPANASKDDSGYAIVNEDENVFMMMPQTLTDAKLVINLTNTNTDKEISLMGDLSGKTWNKGYMVKYVISLNDEREEYELEVLDENGNNIAEYKNGETVVPNTRSFPYYGGYGKYQVRSFKRIISAVGDVTIEQIPWQIDAENTTGVDMLSQMSGNGVTSESGIEGVYTYGTIPTISSNSHTSIMQNAANNQSYDNETYKANPLDLSMVELDTETPLANGRHTANCYLVRLPGYFRIPLVYGNAIKDGVPNVKAYSPNLGETERTFKGDRYLLTNDSGRTPVSADSGDDATANVKVLNNFVDHATGHNNSADQPNPIKHPWIEDQAKEFNQGVYNYNYNFGSAEILWQDSPGLLTDVRLEKFDDPDGGTRDFIRFRVAEESVTAGNALVALKNTEGHVMWSWHIWVTPKPVNTKWIINRRVLGNYSDNDTTSVNWLREENKFELAQYSIGQCDTEDVIYNPGGKTGKIIVHQVDGNGEVLANGKTKIVNISLAENSAYFTPNAPVYQWGRKDPLLPYHKGTGTTTDKVFYDNDRDIRDPNNSSHKDKADPTKTVKEAMVTSKSRKSLSFSINYPHKFIRQTDNGSAETGTPLTNTYTDATNLVIYRNWCTNVYINLWNANCTELPMFAYTYEMKADEFHRQFNELVSIPVEKTVYDPSPAGYEMPRFDTFTGATLRGTNTKPYWYYDQNDSGGNDQYFSPLVNILNSTPWWSNAFEFSIRRKPKISEHVYDKAGIESDQGYWTVGMGHRANTGDAAQYANYGAALTSGIACVQWIGDNGNHKNDYPHNYEIQCLRLAYIHGKPDVLTSENIGTGYGTLRPISGSYMDLAFPIIPVKTGCNPVRTEVHVGSDIVDWKPGDNINLEL